MHINIQCYLVIKVKQRNFLATERAFFKISQCLNVKFKIEIFCTI